MKFAATFLTDPPSDVLVSRAKEVEAAGFDYVFLNEAQTLFMDPWPVFAQMAAATDRISIGPCVTNPTLRDPVVTAALLATLDEMSHGRMVCGIGRGDAAPRTLGRKPATVRQFDDAIRIIRDLVVSGSTVIDGHDVTMRWNPGWALEMWGAGYGPRTLGVVAARCDGVIVQGAALDLLELTNRFSEVSTTDPVPQGSPAVMVAAPAHVGSVDAGHAQLRWFVPSVANHIAALAASYDGPLPLGLTSILEDRTEYDYQAKGRKDNRGADYVTADMTKTFTFVGSAADHIAKIGDLADRGVDVVNLYLHHDDVTATIAAYGDVIIPACR